MSINDIDDKDDFDDSSITPPYEKKFESIMNGYRIIVEIVESSNSSNPIQSKRLYHGCYVKGGMNMGLRGETIEEKKADIRRRLAELKNAPPRPGTVDGVQDNPVV